MEDEQLKRPKLTLVSSFFGCAIIAIGPIGCSLVPATMLILEPDVILYVSLGVGAVIISIGSFRLWRQLNGGLLVYLGGLLTLIISTLIRL